MTVKEFAIEIGKKAAAIDIVLRNDDVSNEVKYYFFGIFITELALFCREAANGSQDA